MPIETVKNRDLFPKICFIYFINHILKILNIDEEIEDVKPNEYITINRKDRFNILNNFPDYIGITKSGKLIIFEFKKSMLRRRDLKQVYNYYRQVYCKEKKDTIAIIIVISKEGKITEYNEYDVTYHPRIIKTKQINKQKDLKIIRDKFKNNIMLSSLECSLLITFPLFELSESESEIVEEMCLMIKNKSNCIPREEFEGIILGMYLNIIEYIDDNKQDKLIEMIDMSEKTGWVIADFKRECMEEGANEGKKEIILKLLDNFTIQNIAEFLKMDVSEIHEILK